MLRAEDQQQRPTAVFHVRRIPKPIRLQPTHHGLPVRYDLRGWKDLVGDHVLHGLVLVAHGEFQAGALEVLDEMLRVAMDDRVIVVLTYAVPVENRAVDAGKFHQQRMTLKGMRIVRIVCANQRPIMRGQFTPALDDFVRLKLVHRPVPAPLAAYCLGFVPRHVMREH